LWYANRLAAMTPAEIAYRAAEALKRRRGARLGGWQRYHLAGVALPSLPIDETRFEEIAAVLAPSWDASWQELRRGEYALLAQHWVEACPDRLWHVDPVTGRTWPQKSYCFDVPFRHAAGYGDVKYVWDLNRLQFLPQLAALARWRDDDEIRSWCLAALDSWMVSNVPFEGVNWASGIELAIRAVSVIAMLSLLDPKRLEAETSEKLCALLNAHAFWLARYPSRYSSANNHLIAEAAGLFVLGSTMPGLPGAAGLRDYGWRTLEREAGRQILDDGVGAEQSPTYTAFTLEWYLVALAAAKQGGCRLPPQVIDRLGRAAGHLCWMTDEAGQQPRIGDDDEGRVIADGSEPDYVCAILGNVSSADGTPMAACPPSRPRLRDIFLGRTAAAAPAPQGRCSFDRGGYTVFRHEIAGRATMLVFDHGPLGYLSIAAHGHADALSVWLHIDGQPVLVDSGTFLYHSGGTVRDYFRGTRAHNTLTLDDCDQSRVAGAFNWTNKAKAWREAADDDGVTARHDGYRRRFGVDHRRRIVRDGQRGYVIVDSIVGRLARPSASACVRYMMAPQLQARPGSDGSVTVSAGDRPLLEMAFTLGAQSASARLVGVEISPCFGVKTLATCIAVEVPAAELCGGGLETRLRMIPEDGQVRAEAAVHGRY
jgi:uncharacterized heparinase superfamily protein